MTDKCLKYLARPEGIEPSAKSLEGSCSIRLSYGRNTVVIKSCGRKVKTGKPLQWRWLDKRLDGVEGAVVVGFVGNFGHDLAIGQRSVGRDNENGA